ncbi:MAG: PD40 domain-containing protein [Phycisphaeraceae bacterium]|nr:PD40 domain-containing protein [Phycisphaeraceae bacterium]MCW5763604.1 PD40 domain-containing protein [Phycisphaeraceae bacterium]
MRNVWFWSVLAGLAASAAAMIQDKPDAGMFRYPDISAKHIAFSYSGDIWVVDRMGGEARKLVGPRGDEVLARFSPDGSRIAFVGNYEGNSDLYTIPVEGGIAERVTYHPGTEILCEWTEQDELLFYMSGLSGLGRMTQLFTVSASGGHLTEMPIPYGAVGSISPDGAWLAYTPHTTDNRTWKRYRGGMATDIWLYNLNDNTARQITDWEGTDTSPMWHGGRLYYLSDDGPTHRLNIWVFDPASGRREAVTALTEYDIKAPSIGPGERGEGEIIFQFGPELRVLRLDNRTIRTVDVRISGDFAKVRPVDVDPSNLITSWSVSPTAKRVAVSARGDVWTLPAEKGAPRNLTRTDGAFERNPTWSPDGRWIAYFSDETGEYELYITQSDGAGETKKLTDFAGDSKPTFFYGMSWSPDSKKIAFTDKAANVWMLTLAHDDEEGNAAAASVSHVTRDMWANQPSISWSHDSRWLTYAIRQTDEMTGSVYVYDTTTNEEHRVTSGYFNDSAPVFDRKGTYLFYSSNRTFSPTYADMDTTFIYSGTEVMLAVPLKADGKYPWLPTSDEETWKDEAKKKEEKKDDAKDQADDGEGADEADDSAPEGESKAEPSWKDDGVTGLWEGTAKGGAPLPPSGLPVSFELQLRDGSNVTGSMSSAMGSTTISSGTWDAGSKSLTLTLTMNNETITWNLTVSGNSMSGTISGVMGTFTFEANRSRIGPTEGAAEADKAKDDKAEKEGVEIDFEGFESRAFRLPIASGRFGARAVNDQNQLIYARFSTGGSGGSSGIMLFDMTSDDKSEKTVSAGAGGFDMSADGKNLLVVRGSSATIQKASAGSSGKAVSTSGMRARIDPRTEWSQILRDAWRRHRDFFYVENMHGVDWPAVLTRYENMLKYASSRTDVSFIIGEMIAELNVGHAYYWGGDIETAPSVSVGLLGVDFELAQDEAGNAGYRIAKIHEGGPWDDDARGPLSLPGVDAHEGDFLLAVNGIAMDVEQSPYALFQGIAGRATQLTLSKNAVLGDDDDRRILVEPIGSEQGLRTRAWVEAKRRYVDEKTGGRVGYIYVPNTGVEGQNELIRGFYGQLNKSALIIDERWNGGGQIPTRFIELLKRPRTNYWARRDGQDWPWPPDSHQGPKVMLINGLAGSGGDMFPALFKEAGLGKLIGTRTWGGLVGITGMPGLVDGGYTAVPTFGYYRPDGSWGIEGHGVDADIEVIDDPSMMVDGGDPQLDAAITHILEELERRPYVRPARPASPDRSGFGISDTDR